MRRTAARGPAVTHSSRIRRCRCCPIPALRPAAMRSGLAWPRRRSWPTPGSCRSVRSLETMRVVSISTRLATHASWARRMPSWLRAASRSVRRRPRPMTRGGTHGNFSNASCPGGVVPAIADANSLEYSLHLAVGDELTVHGSGGAPGATSYCWRALRDSVLQGAIVVSEGHFLRAFASQQGYRFFLVETPATRASALRESLAERLAESGVRIEAEWRATRAIPSRREHVSLDVPIARWLGTGAGDDRAPGGSPSKRARASRRARAASGDRLPGTDTGRHGGCRARGAPHRRSGVWGGVGAGGDRTGTGGSRWSASSRHDRPPARGRDHRRPDLVADWRSRRAEGPAARSPQGGRLIADS